MIHTSMQNGSGRNFFSNRMLFSSHCVLLMGLLFAVPIWSQTGSSTVRGTVKDPSDALVSGATVTLTSLETNAERSMRTTSSGTFAFEFLPVR